MDSEMMMAGGPEAPSEQPVNQAHEQCVPLAALEIPDGEEQMAAPEMGDVVSYQVEGKVSRIEGDKAYVTPTAINGQEVAAEAPAQPEPAARDDYSELEEMAKGMN